MDKPLLLLDLQKSNKNGLVQQVITYVRDGRTITRKQWVRSEFADHAKKNEEQRKKTMIKQAEKEKKKKEKELEEGNMKQALKDMADRRKMHSIKRSGEEPKTDEEREMYKKRRDLAKKTREEELKRYEDDNRRRNKQEKESKDKDNRSAYGQEDQTRADSKREIDNIIRLHRDNAGSTDGK